MEINYSSESPGKVRYEPLVIALYQGPRFAIAGIQYRSTVISPYNKMRAEAPQNSFQQNRNAPVDGYSVASRGHTLGSRSFAAAITIEANKPNGKVPDFCDRYMASHTLKDGGWIDPQCEEARMVAMRDEASQSGCLLTDEELSRSNLGEAKYYIRGFGVGPRPSSFSSQSNSNSARQELQKVQSELELLREERQREREEYERRWEEERNRRDEERRQREEQQRQRDEQRQREFDELKAMMMRYMHGRDNV